MTPISSTRQVSSLHRTLDQELTALLRGASLECLACGEFVMHARGGSVFCPECGSPLQIKLTCPGCGFQPENAPKFCPECGVKMPLR